jgi:hypothetical protein
MEGKRTNMLAMGVKLPGSSYQAQSGDQAPGRASLDQFDSLPSGHSHFQSIDPQFPNARIAVNAGIAGIAGIAGMELRSDMLY